MSAAGKARVPAWTWVVLLAAAAAAVFILRPAADERDAAEATVVTTLPRLIDLGADKCVPCKMMAPVLEELTAEYADRFEVDFIDVWKQPERGDAYAVNLIPTQIFLAADGTPGRYHATNAGVCTWFEFAREIAAREGHDPAKVRPCTSAEYPTPARRPACSVLHSSALEARVCPPRPDWRDALDRYLELLRREDAAEEER